jgi:hypothetical protein
MGLELELKEMELKLEVGVELLHLNQNNLHLLDRYHYYQHHHHRTLLSVFEVIQILMRLVWEASPVLLLACCDSQYQLQMHL